jgi:hypothetical protein
MIKGTVDLLKLSKANKDVLYNLMQQSDLKS